MMTPQTVAKKLGQKKETAIHKSQQLNRILSKLYQEKDDDFMQPSRVVAYLDLASEDGALTESIHTFKKTGWRRWAGHVRAFFSGIYVWIKHTNPIAMRRRRRRAIERTHDIAQHTLRIISSVTFWAQSCPERPHGRDAAVLLLLQKMAQIGRARQKPVMVEELQHLEIFSDRLCDNGKTACQDLEEYLHALITHGRV